MMRWFLYISLFVIASSCSVFEFTPSVDVNNYSKQFQKEKASYTLIQNVNSVDFNLSYIPYELQVANSLKQGDYSLEEAKGMQKEFNIEHTFRLDLYFPIPGNDIYSYNLNSNFNKEERLFYYMNELKKDVFIVTANQDTIPCINSLLEQGISNMNVATFLFDFNSVNRQDIETLIFRDKILAESEITFDIAKMNLTKIPKLSFKGYEK